MEHGAAAAQAGSQTGSGPLDPARGRPQLLRRLRKLQSVFDLPAIRREPLGVHDVVTYYEDCQDAYRKYHSAEGAVHMALNADGRFDADGYRGQLRLLEQRWQGRAPAVVLELGFGQGFNLAYLAPRHPAVHFEGIDLTPTHLALASRRLADRPAGQVTLRGGDFHHLPQSDGSIDEAFCIEAMCHAADLPLALAEAARVLHPGGALALFDGYLLRPAAELDEAEALAVDLVAKGLAVNGLQQLEDLLAAARAAGLEAVTVQALDREVMPTLARLERITGAVIRWPWLGRRALARRTPARSRNVLAGYLMRTAVSLGLIGYRHIVLRKSAVTALAP